MFNVSGSFYNIRALQRTSNQEHRMRRKKVRNENGAHGNIKDLTDFYGFFGCQKSKGVDSNVSKKFFMASKIMFRVSGDFYNIRAL